MASIVTLTVNPCLDVSASVDAVVHERKLRCSSPAHEPGGGGVNVARAIRRLGGEATAVWALGGHTGGLVSELLDREGVTHEPVPVSGITRESVTILETSSGQQYRFLFPGPELDADDVERIERTLAQRDPHPDLLVLSGSLPPGVPDDLYARIASAMGPHVRVIVDTSGPALRHTVRRGVFLIKPNIGELRSLIGRPLDTDASIEHAARELLAAERAHVVAVSLGAGGALVVMRHACHHVRSPPVHIHSRVGAGDSMVAGITLALARGLEPLPAVRFGVAAGAAAVMTPGSQLCRREDTERLYAGM